MNTKKIFGEFFKQKRIERGYTLRNFCQEHNLDPGNISKMERGLLKPPSREKLEQYAIYLEIDKGSDDWYAFFDLAAACKGELPFEILDDATLVEKLPLIFRTIRGQKVSPDLLDKLAELIRNS